MGDTISFVTQDDSVKTIETLRRIAEAKARRPTRKESSSWEGLRSRVSRLKKRPDKHIRFQPRVISILGGLEERQAQLTADDARHFLSRVSFGPQLDEVESLTGRQLGDVVDELVDGTLARGVDPEPEWTTILPPPWPHTEAESRAYTELVEDWIVEVTTDSFVRFIQGGFQERLTLFWHNHFVTQHDSYWHATYMRRYVDTLRRHCVGDFREFVRDIGRTEAMLLFLDLALNNKYSPNDNYSRELLELFTMGIRDSSGSQNYTEADIGEIARALTGYQTDWESLSSGLTPHLFDDTPKTIFGRTENFDYDGVVDLLFAERGQQISEFICRKIYREFVQPTADEAIVAELAGIFLANDFQLAPVFRVLLKSEHFWDPQLRATRIKSPIEKLVHFIRAVDGGIRGYWSGMSLSFQAEQLGQFNFEPVNVAGWPGHETWISTSSFPQRWVYSDWVLGMLAEYYHQGDDDPDRQYELAGSLRDTILRLTGGGGQYAALEIPGALARHLLSVPIEELDIPAVANDLAGDLHNHPLPQFVLDAHPNELNLIKTFLAGVPWYEWNLQLEWSRWTIANYYQFLAELPEYQLT